MRGPAVFLFFLIIPALFFSAPAQAQKTPSVIASISIEGNGDIEIKEIKSVISEIVPPGKLFFWKSSPEFDELKVERNIDSLRQFLAGSGYYSSSVIWRAGAGNRKNVALKIDINLGYPVTVYDVSFDIKGNFTPGQIREIWESLDGVPLTRGDRFSVIRFKKAKGVVKNTLLEMGYARATLDSTAEVHRGERRASVSFRIEPGSLYTFGNIDIQLPEGDLRTLVIENISYKTGESASPSKLLDSKRRLLNLGYFDSVSISNEIDDETAVIHTVVSFVRSKTMTVQLGVGAGNVDKLRGRVKFINRNFLNLNRTLEISARSSFVSQGVETVIRKPGAFGTDSSLALLFDIRRDDFPSYEADFLIGSAEIRKAFTDSGFSVHFIPTVLGSEIKAQSVDPNITRGLEDIFLVTLRPGFDFVKVDNPVDPGRGFTAGLEVEFSGRFMGSEQEYVKTVLETAGYFNIGDFVLAKKIQTGFLKPFGRTRREDIPLFTRLFAGGSKSMRGFAFQELGRLDSDGNPLGGNTLVTGNAEVRFPIAQKLGAVVFLDYGNVFSRSFDYDLDELRYAVGAGLRYKVAGIPIALDFGYTLNPNDRLRRYQIFFDVGQAF